MLNTFQSLKRLQGVDFEMIDIPVQITQQETIQMPNIIIKRHTNPPNRLIIAKKTKTKAEQ